MENRIIKTLNEAAASREEIEKRRRFLKQSIRRFLIDFAKALEDLEWFTTSALNWDADFDLALPPLVIEAIVRGEAPEWDKLNRDLSKALDRESDIHKEVEGLRKITGIKPGDIPEEAYTAWGQPILKRWADLYDYIPLSSQRKARSIKDSVVGLARKLRTPLEYLREKQAKREYPFVPQKKVRKQVKIRRGRGPYMIQGILEAFRFKSVEQEAKIKAHYLKTMQRLKKPILKLYGWIDDLQWLYDIYSWEDEPMRVNLPHRLERAISGYAPEYESLEKAIKDSIHLMTPCTGIFLFYKGKLKRNGVSWDPTIGKIPDVFSNDLLRYISSHGFDLIRKADALTSPTGFDRVFPSTHPTEDRVLDPFQAWAVEMIACYETLHEIKKKRQYPWGPLGGRKVRRQVRLRRGKGRV